ncbi:MAG: class I tRNA ligase family protein, partial [Patescibacteria group bacterium]
MLEKEILKFWQENKIFEKSLDKKSPKGDFVFYDGPPFATGTPHYGHILASIIKDAIPRYKTMKGYKVKRRWGWDCHGLPVEYEIEKELGFKTKKEIENYGVEKFNKAAKDSVLRYADEWKKTIARIGRWVDMENDYKTMDWEYTESVWWVFKTLFDKELIYEGYKSMHLCPRCETTLSNLEVGMNYKDITDISVTVKFELENELNTYILAWTTTPWTLPGNAALAINPEIEYVKIRTQTTNNEPQQFILAKKRLEILGEEKYEILDNFKGEELIGKKYKPLFNYYLPAVASAKEGAKDEILKNLENGWKIYSSDFVTTEEGTGVVHIAPAFGEDDYNLAQKHNLPFIQHVSIDGRFKQEVKDFAGMPVKSKDNSQATDIEIIKWLAVNNKLFSKLKISHSYPYCWRCDTPLINYAASSWFMKVAAIKNKLIEINKKINWIPEYIKEGRFGNWLKEARDWAISRSRFWGAPIPVWKCQKCEKIEIIGSLNDLKNKTEKSGNKYFVMRHGEAQSNIENIASCNIKNGHHLTEKGKKQVAITALKLKGEKIDMIFSSDYLRTKETSEIMVEKLGINGDDLIFDERIREVNVGIFDGQSAEEYHKYFFSLEEKFYKNPPEGENLIELKNRVAEFLYEINIKYSGKNILIISHEYSIWLMFATALGADAKKAVEIKKDKPDFIKTGEFQELDFAPIPHNRNYEIDLHRPYIDEVELRCNCGGKMKRILEVFDCWFESGSMPYGQTHYPFSGEKFAFPAEFIAEGLDQTRGWFYTMLVLSAAIFNKSAYKNAVVNGIILAEDGQKMSKRLKNYPDPMEIIEKYGADALRLYLLSSPVMRAEDLRFSEKSHDEIYKKVIIR